MTAEPTFTATAAALAVADWLDAAARLEDREHVWLKEAPAVARAYLGATP